MILAAVMPSAIVEFMSSSAIWDPSARVAGGRYAILNKKTLRDHRDHSSKTYSRKRHVPSGATGVRINFHNEARD